MSWAWFIIQFDLGIGIIAKDRCHSYLLQNSGVGLVSEADVRPLLESLQEAGWRRFLGLFCWGEFLCSHFWMRKRLMSLWSLDICFQRKALFRQQEKSKRIVLIDIEILRTGYLQTNTKKGKKMLEDNTFSVQHGGSHLNPLVP